MMTPRSARRSLPTPVKDYGTTSVKDFEKFSTSRRERDLRRYSKPDAHNMSGTGGIEGSPSPESPPQECGFAQKGSRSPTLRGRRQGKCGSSTSSGSSSNEAATQTALGAVSASFTVLQAVEEEEDGPARLVDVQQRLQEMQSRIVADVEQKLQEHGARWRAELAEEVARQLAVHLNLPEREESVRSGRSTARSCSDCSVGVSSLRHEELVTTGLCNVSSGGSLEPQPEPCTNSIAWKEPPAEQQWPQTQHGNAASRLHRQSSAGANADNAEEVVCPRTDLAVRFAAIERLLLRSKQQVGAAAVAPSARHAGTCRGEAHDARSEDVGDTARPEVRRLTSDSGAAAAAAAAAAEAAEAAAAATTAQSTAQRATGKDAGQGQPLLKVLPPVEEDGNTAEHFPGQLCNMASASQPRMRRAASPELSDILERRRSISEGRTPCQQVLSPRTTEQLLEQAQQQHRWEQQQQIHENDSSPFRRALSSRALRNGQGW
mmetsp:Transcript_117925/g.234930  ORF Transcript_117925/g.234930 Transcript_117925/m.234930 type:complete len:490 (-) Transcript_117925:61-1530(-)